MKITIHSIAKKLGSSINLINLHYLDLLSRNKLELKKKELTEFDEQKIIKMHKDFLKSLNKNI